MILTVFIKVDEPSAVVKLDRFAQAPLPNHGSSRMITDLLLRSDCSKLTEITC